MKVKTRCPICHRAWVCPVKSATEEEADVVRMGMPCPTCLRMIEAANMLDPPDKLCKMCGEVKPISEFHINRQKLDGHQRLCKTCCSHQRTGIAPPQPTAVAHCGRIVPFESLSISEPARCADYLDCEHYDDCLNVAAKCNWRGWRVA